MLSRATATHYTLRTHRPVSSQITGVDAIPAAFVGPALRGPVDEPVRVRCFEEFEAVFGGLWDGSTLPHCVSHYFMNGGPEAVIVRVVARGNGSRRKKRGEGDPQLSQSDYLSDGRGIYALDRVDAFNLLCVPPLVVPDGGPCDFTDEFWSDAIAYCRRRHAMAIINPKRAWKRVADLVRDPLPEDENALLYYPNVLVPDPLHDGAAREWAPCGVVAGVIARTDARRGFWRAPAGVDARLSGVSGLAVKMSDADNRELAALGVNALRTLPVAGTVVWGARTLTRVERFDAAWKYLPVRRIALYIEQSIRLGLRLEAGQAGDTALRGRMCAEIEAFLHRLYLAGVLHGESARDAYFVRCDTTATTRRSVSNEAMHIVIGIAPLKAGQFVRIDLTVNAPAHGATPVRRSA